MILDRLLRFSEAQDLSQIIGDYASTDVIDFGLGTAAAPAIPSNANGGGVRDMGIGTPLKMLVQIIEAFASAGAATLAIALQAAPDDGTGAPGSYVTYWTSPVYALADLVAGARLLQIDFPRPPQGEPVNRFYRLLYTIAGDTTTAGTISAWVAPIVRDDQMYNADNNAILGGYRAGINVAN